MNSHKQGGFSLIELVVFMVIVSVAISGVFFAFNVALQKMPGVNAQTIANELAQSRIDLIIGQRRMNGFNSVIDPCASGTLPAICNLPVAFNAYTISSSINSTVIDNDSNYKLISVSVSGPQGANAELRMLVALY